MTMNSQPARLVLVESLAIGALVFAACMVGIQTRLLFSLASIWPANALLFGVLILRPSTNNGATWILSGLGYVGADLISQSPLENALLLNGTNLLGVSIGVAVMDRLSRSAQFLTRPLDAVATIGVIMLASAATGTAGGAIGPILFGMNWVESLGLWFSAELVNYTIFLPPLLALLRRDRQALRFFSRNANQRRHQLAALSSLALSVVVMHWAGGPGATSYMIPALIWCAVCFRPFACAILTMLICVWLLIAGPLGLMPLNIDFYNATDASSFRLGVGMIAGGTLAVSIINSAWRAAHAALLAVASRDALTGLLNRGAFMERLDLAFSRRAQAPFAVLMVDVDHFKAINDTHGHPAGDAVLRTMARLLTDNLRDGDICGRVGGEEFALIVSGTAKSEGLAVADRIQSAARQMTTQLDDGFVIQATLSIGVGDSAAHTSVDQLLVESDKALYAAKHGGRNRVAVADAAAALV
jgi:diguanylate cyclase (GGDEF)-like protein